jgi:hypothetical protein
MIALLSIALSVGAMAVVFTAVKAVCFGTPALRAASRTGPDQNRLSQVSEFPI